MTFPTARYVLVAALAAAPVSLTAQDVRPYSEKEAEAVLSDEQCPVKLPNGQCARSTDERGWSLGSVQPRATPQPTPNPSANLRRPQPRATGVDRSTNRSPNRRVIPQQEAAAVARPQQLPLQFSLGSFELSPQSKANLATLAAALRSPANAGKKIRITGHTDKSGSPDVNRSLSQRRADAAADYIAGQGVDRSRIEAIGRGFDSLLPGVSPYSAANRRVEVERTE